MGLVYGNILELAADGQFDVIVHGCNCFCQMGAGLSKQIKQRFPEAYQADQKTRRRRHSRIKLGTISVALIKRIGMSKDIEFTIVNAYTQYHYKGKGPHASYPAIRSAFKEVKHKFSGLKIGYPKIGAGLAGGNWEMIEEIINEELQGEEHILVSWQPGDCPNLNSLKYL